MRYAAIADWATDKQYSVTFMCAQLGVVRQGYYRWLADGPCERERTDAELTEAAQVAARGKGTYLAAHHAQIRGRRGTQKAIGATRHDILIAYYHIVANKVAYHDLGPDWNERRRSTEQQTKRLVRQLERLGLNVTIEPSGA